MPEGHYFDADPKVVSKPREVDLVLPDLRARLRTDAGTFSARGVDPGTLQLLRATPPPPAAGNLLDLGCGYGPIACTLAHRSPGSVVWAVDINDRALRLAAENAGDLGLANVTACRPETVPAEIRFDGIWSNPPIRIGKAALHELLGSWLARLREGSAAWLVVQRHLGSDSLAAWLTAEGWQVTRTGSKRGYRILRIDRA
jgi:16S rRNA (guanine1207-N2)-methyltransferase